MLTNLKALFARFASGCLTEGAGTRVLARVNE